MPNRAQEHMEAINGTWKGVVIERGKLKYPMKANLRLVVLDDGIPKIEGRADYDIEDHKDLSVKFDGRFLDGFERLQLDYRNEDPKILNYGVVLLRLSTDGNRLEGEFMEFNHLDVDMISGTISIEKE
jgi:hypothetical protein